MSAEKMSCRECSLCNMKNEECSLTGRKVTLDSLRNCKKGIRIRTLEDIKDIS